MSYDCCTVTIQDLGNTQDQLRLLAIDQAKQVTHSAGLPCTWTASLVRGQPGSWRPVQFRVYRGRRRPCPLFRRPERTAS